MLFLFIVGTICKHIYDFTTGLKGDELEIYFNPRDIVDVKVAKNIGVFFSYWNYSKDLYLNVDTISPDGDITEYGPFNHKNKLMGIVFQTMDYTLKFTYEGEKGTKMGIIFSEGIFPNETLFGNQSFQYPVLNEIHLTDKYEEYYFKSPFIYYLDIPDSQTNIAVAAGVAILGIFYIAFHFCCKDLDD